LNLKKIEVESKYINLAKGEQNNEEYLKINPNHAVPALVLEDGTVLVESVAIIEYLE
jgi:glutathione S-transferase